MVTVIVSATIIAEPQIITNTKLLYFKRLWLFFLTFSQAGWGRGHGGGVIKF